MASKFFKTGNSSSESDSDSSSSEEEKVKKIQRKEWNKEFSSEDEDVEVKRVIRSGTDKRFAQLQEQVKTLRNRIKITDYASMITDYEASLRMLTKMMSQPGGPEKPKFYIKAICDLEDHLNAVHASGEKKSFPTNKAKAYNTLRAKVRKQNADFAEELEHCRAFPDEYEEEVESESSDDSDGAAGSDSDSGEKKKGSEDSSDFSDSGADSSSDSSDFSMSSKSSEDSDLDEDAIRQKRRRRWLKTEADYESERREKEQKERMQKLAEERKMNKISKAKEGGKKNFRKDGVEDAIKKQEDPDNTIHQLKTEDLKVRLKDLVQVRGRKSVDRSTFKKKLEFYLNVSREYEHGPAMELFLLTHIINFEFDSYSGAWFESMRLVRWEQASHLLQQFFTIFSAWTPTEEELELEAEEAKGDDFDDTFTHGTLFRLFILSVIKLDEELYKACQFATKELQDYLICTAKVIIFLKDVAHWLLSIEAPAETSRVCARLLEHIYFKTDTDNQLAFQFMKNELGYDITTRHENLGDWSFQGEASFALIKLLADIIDSGITERSFSLRSQLCRAYHFAIHNRFREGRDILHFLSMYERICESDTHAQILYNRAFAQVGLCAFRKGLIPEAHHYLMELCTYNKAKELLAQGVAFQRFNEKNPEQEKTERRRQLPYHMHIPLDQLDAAHLISALILEVPNMLLQALNPGHRRLISRALRKYLDAMDKHVFLTPPETTREYILHAAMAVSGGEWKTAHTHLRKVKFLADLISEDILMREIKESSLRCYCLKHSTAYDSLDLGQLTEMFELPEKECHSIISRMILEGEVCFAWDSQSRILLVKHEDNQSKFQRLTQTLAEKCAMQLENHERVVDYKTGHYSKQDDRQQYGYGKGGGFRDVFSDEVRYFNRTKYANMPRAKGQILAGAKGFKGTKGRKGKGKGGFAKSGTAVRASGWNRGARDYTGSYSGPRDNGGNGRSWGGILS